jgi:hypothetical protein
LNDTHQFLVYAADDNILEGSVRGATQKFAEFKQCNRTGCFMPFRR